MLTDEQAIFAEVFHTGLRKALYTIASSICWNAIHLLEKEDWYNFLAVVYESIKDGAPLSRDICLSAITFGEAPRNLFRIGLKMLHDEEYDALSNWYIDCTK